MREALALRAEAASGPDRELDAAIAAALGLRHGPARGWINNHNGDYFTVDECAARYTASLDAAMTLVEGLGGQVTFFKDGTAKAFLWQPYPLAVEVKAATPALALCAAALRAKEAQE